jgi:prepilin-type N-terminal cleavage/methylation domain-containing protein
MILIQKFLKNNHKGFTLVELLVAIAITAIIGSALAMSISQLFTVSSADKNRMEAVKQLENALHYINRDAQMAFPSNISPSSTDIPPTNLSGSGLELKWTDFYDQIHTIKYSLVTQNSIICLQRSEQLNTGSPTLLIVARNIEPSVSKSYYSYVFSENILTIHLSSTVTGLRSATESRTLTVNPRTTQ